MIIPSRNPKLYGKEFDSHLLDLKRVSRVSHCQDKRSYIVLEDLISQVPELSQIAFASFLQA